MGSLSAACLLANKGKKITIIEQNYLPGGCTSSYWRKGFVFESGATTFVGLDKGQPLHYLTQKLGIQWQATPLALPMQIRLKDGSIINRYQPTELWIQEAKAEFGYPNQEAFWKLCYRISKFVWEVSLKQLLFPPTNFRDLVFCINHATLKQAWYARWTFVSMKQLLKLYNLYQNQRFVEFVNAQLLITAQNTCEHVNVLFGATALCYTNYSNYYIKGGMMGCVNPLLDFLYEHNAEVNLRERVIKVSRTGSAYRVITTKSEYFTKAVFCGIPLNNWLEICDFTPKSKQKSAMPARMLNSAFQVGIGFKSSKKFNSLHYQIHLEKPLPYIQALTLFVSLNHDTDTERCDVPGTRVMSVSTHWPTPDKAIPELDKSVMEKMVIDTLVKHQFFTYEDVVYSHSSTPDSWEKWTGRKWGFVGGYPQYMHIKPWQMPDARIDNQGAYLVGDSAYPGQGIPGVALSGIIAYHKYMRDQGLQP